MQANRSSRGPNFGYQERGPKWTEPYRYCAVLIVFFIIGFCVFQALGTRTSTTECEHSASIEPVLPARRFLELLVARLAPVSVKHYTCEANVGPCFRLAFLIASAPNGDRSGLQGLVQGGAFFWARSARKSGFALSVPLAPKHGVCCNRNPGSGRDRCWDTGHQQMRKMI